MNDDEHRQWQEDFIKSFLDGEPHCMAQPPCENIGTRWGQVHLPGIMSLPYVLCDECYAEQHHHARQSVPMSNGHRPVTEDYGW